MEKARTTIRESSDGQGGETSSMTRKEKRMGREFSLSGSNASGRVVDIVSTVTEARLGDDDV